MTETLYGWQEVFRERLVVMNGVAVEPRQDDEQCRTCPGASTCQARSAERPVVAIGAPLVGTQTGGTATVDIRIGSPTTTYGMSEPRYGVIADIHYGYIIEPNTED